jgi:hypothetical protein
VEIMTIAASAAAIFLSVIMIGGALKALMDWAQEDIRKARQRDLDTALKKVRAQHRGGQYEIRPLAEWPEPHRRPLCYHFEIVPVESAVSGEDIAAWCPACETQLDTKWIDRRYRAVQYHSNQLGSMIILPLEAQKRAVEEITSMFTIKRI